MQAWRASWHVAAARAHQLVAGQLHCTAPSQTGACLDNCTCWACFLSSAEHLAAVTCQHPGEWVCCEGKYSGVKTFLVCSSVEYRLSDVREDTSGLGDLSMGGHFDDLLHPLPEENEELPGPGAHLNDCYSHPLHMWKRHSHLTAALSWDGHRRGIILKEKCPGLKNVALRSVDLIKAV